MPTEIKTDQTLLDRLKAAAMHEMTNEEIRRQRLSFVFGNMPSESAMTKHQVEAALARIEGEVVS